MLMIFNLLLVWNCLFASLVIICKNSIYSLISLIFVIIGSCLSLLFLKIEFLIFILLLVYVGAIAVLFLFVIIMLELNINHKKKPHTNLYYHFLFSLLLILKVFFFSFFFNKQLALNINNFSHEYIKYNEDLDILYYFTFIEINDIHFFINLFTQKYVLFITIGILLLFSMIGSITLCIKPK